MSEDLVEHLSIAGVSRTLGCLALIVALKAEVAAGQDLIKRQAILNTLAAALASAQR